MVASAAILFGVTAQKREAERLQNELAALRSELLSGASSGTAEVFSALSQAQQQAWERQDQHLRDFAGQSAAGQAALQQALTAQLRFAKIVDALYPLLGAACMLCFAAIFLKTRGKNARRSCRGASGCAILAPINPRKDEYG